MSDRRAQWIRFYEAALSGAVTRTIDFSAAAQSAAERIADAAMARLDARDFPPSKVEALADAARDVWSRAEVIGTTCKVPEQHVDALGKALADLKEQT